MDSVAFIRIAFYVFSAVAAIFLVEAVYLTVAAPLMRRRAINRRLLTQGQGKSGEETLAQLKLERGIVGSKSELSGSLTRLLIQSGLHVTPKKLLLAMALAFVTLVVALSVFTILAPYYVVLIGVIVSILLPLLIVRFIRDRRIAKFATQLPDGLDIVVRSLRSGHPISVALSLVGREMQDPIGTEFGITIDEMTYGLDMPRALRNLADRVGLADLSLLVTAVSLQSTSGGNLTEVLGNLSRVLRQRFQLRRKVRSLSAEGRFSAYGLTLLPILIAAGIFVQNQGYYLDVWDEPPFLPGMIALGVWSLIGDLIMYKMINFKY